MTLKQIKALIINWFNAHVQVGEVIWGDIDEYTAKKDKEFVSVNVEYIRTTLAQRTMNHNYRISIGDLMNANYPEMEDDIFSSTMLIAQDFFAFLSNEDDFIFLDNLSINPFSDTTGDRISGVTFSIVLQCGRVVTECDKPENNL